MANRSPDVMGHSLSNQERDTQLRGAYVRLALTLQSLDLEDETQLADDVIKALRATDRALDVAEKHGR